MSVSAVPVGATAALRDAKVSGTTAVLTITASTGTLPGTFPVTISATASGETIAPLTLSLTVTPALGLPAITGFAPAGGPAGTRVSVAGARFNDAQLVVFSGISASFTIDSATAITATLPAGAPIGPGAISVQNAQGLATSPTAFLVTASKDQLKEKEKELKESKEKESDGKNLRKDLKDNRENKGLLEGPLSSTKASQSSVHTVGDAVFATVIQTARLQTTGMPSNREVRRNYGRLKTALCTR